MTTTTPTRSPATESAWRIVAGREIMVKLRDRNFIISTLTTIAIFVVAFGLSFLLGGRDDEKTVAVASNDASAIVHAAAAAATPDREGAEEGTGPGAQAGVPPIELSVTEVADPAAAEQAVRDGVADAALLGRPGAWTLVGSDGVDPGIAAAVGSVVAADALERNAAAVGATVSELTAGSVVEERLLDPDGAANEGVQLVAGFVFVFLFYMAAILFGYAIANSVVEEKQSRIVEILAAAIPLRQLLVGKVVGATALALGQMAIFVAIGLIGLTFTDYSALLPSVAGAAGWYLVLFVIGFVALACLFAVAGALATRAEDVQSTSSPLLTLIMIASFAGLFLQGTWQVIGSYVPIMSTVTMPIRLVEGTAHWWEPVIAAVITLIAAGAVMVVAERVYRRSIMQTGGKLTYRQALALTE
ncbi:MULTISPECIES: ABC transporter permease [unclassified Dietzia]|uniref:ABC transporter permease n=1 Tax=unclassified Dietzia TaxID=2617939 RepID=UPI000D20240A|nr:MULTISPECIES: ABC transporter permease [unclassified Dietzia]AVZ40653.1 ABC transporter permease [Dietzia sp. JS16-p6b]QGW26227.1 ABC-type Na efflux pump permease component- like protein [Dietzia sp. DQ12-45-1b]